MGKQNDHEEVLKALVFYRNHQRTQKATDAIEAQGDHPCNSNCDCYIEIEMTRAAGIGGYRMGM